MAGQRVYNALKDGAEAPMVKGPTHDYGVTPSYADSYQGILRQAYLDAKYQTNGFRNEAAVSLGRPGFFNGNRWNYRSVSQGPTPKPYEKGAVELSGHDTLHLHLAKLLTEGGQGSINDIRLLQQRLAQPWSDHDATMAVGDRMGNVAIYGFPNALKKRGFSDAQIQSDTDDAYEKNPNGARRALPAGLDPVAKVLLPTRYR